MTRKPNTIRARIADEAISRVTRFFDGTLSQTLHEVLQNARRSGAASVAITYHRATDRLTVADDGRGIADPRTLLAFGKTGWDRNLQAAESPAGMGVFSLARRSPRIRSRVAGLPPWAVELGEDHFVGRAAAAITDAGDYRPAHGTEVTFSILPDDTCWAVGHLSEAVRHYPLPVSIDGRKPEQTDFLKDAVRVETWRGLRIGVFSSTSPSWATPNINFHGLQVMCQDLPQVHALPAADSSAPRTWWAMADVVDCPELELTLPARTAIIQTPFVPKLVNEARGAIYRTIAGCGFAPRLGYETRKTAHAAGVPLPEDPRQLTPWRPQNARDAKPLERPRHPDLQHAMLVDDDVLDAAESQNLAWAARETGTLGRYWETEDQLKGYAWYDALPRVVGVNVRVTACGRTETSTRQTRRDHAPCRRGPVDRLELELIVKRPGCDASDTIRMPTSAALLSRDGSGVSRDDPDFVTSRDAGIDTDALETALLDAYFQPSLDAEADSLDTQMREYRRRMAYSITELLDSAEAAADGTIRTLVESCILPVIDGGSNVDIEIRNGSLAAVRRL